MQIQEENQDELEEYHFEMLLTQHFYQKVNQYLPQGYSLQPAKKKNNRKKDNPATILKKKNERNQLEIQKNKSVPQENIDIDKFEKIILLLKIHPQSKPFLNPVNPKKEGIPQYSEVIKEPMDLSTVHRNLKINKYKNKNQIIQDLNKIWNNALIFNPQGSQIYNMAIEMQTRCSSLLFLSKKETMKLCEGKEFRQVNQYSQQPQNKQKNQQQAQPKLESMKEMRNFESQDDLQINKQPQSREEIIRTKDNQNVQQNTKRLNKESSLSKSSFLSSLNSDEN